jgi:hypothetical protein
LIGPLEASPKPGRPHFSEISTLIGLAAAPLTACTTEVLRLSGSEIGKTNGLDILSTALVSFAVAVRKLDGEVLV